MLKALALLSPWGDPPVVQDSGFASGITQSTCQIRVTSLPALQQTVAACFIPRAGLQSFSNHVWRNYNVWTVGEGEGKSMTMGPVTPARKAGHVPRVVSGWQVPLSSVCSSGLPSTAPDGKPGTMDMSFLQRIWSKICWAGGGGGERWLN